MKLVLKVLKEIGFKKSNVVLSIIPSTPPWLLIRPVINLDLHCSDKSNTPPEIFRHRFYELYDHFKNYHRIFTVLKSATELQLPWFIETIPSVFDYQTLQAFSELSYMPFC